MLADLRRAVIDALPRPGGPPPLAANLSPDEVTVVVGRGGLGAPRPGEVRRRPLAAGPGPEGWPELAAALEELRGELGLGDDDRPDLHLALAPPLARARVVELPAADREALRTLAHREADRHLLSVPADRVADAWPLERAREGPSPCVLACADAGAARAAARALETAGFRPGLAGPSAWTAAEGAAALDGELTEGSVLLRLRDGDRDTELALEDGRLAGVRPLAPDADAGDDAPRASRRTVDDAHPLAGLDAPGLAAFGALVAPEEGPALLPPEARAGWRRRRRARAGLLAAAAALLLAAAGWIHLWGLDRELAAVEARRASVAEAVEEARSARDAALRLADLLEGVAAAARPGPPWSRVVAEVGRRLPTSSYLRVLDAGGEGAVRLAGDARSPSSLVPRLAASPLFADVTLASVTRSPAGGGGGDAFEITFRLAGGAAAADTAGPGSAADTTPDAGEGTSPGSSATDTVGGAP